MSGLENMKRQILDEANHAAEEKISEAKVKAEEILKEARKQMDAEKAGSSAGKTGSDTGGFGEGVSADTASGTGVIF